MPLACSSFTIAPLSPAITGLILRAVAKKGLKSCETAVFSQRVQVFQHKVASHLIPVLLRLPYDLVKFQSLFAEISDTERYVQLSGRR